MSKPLSTKVLDRLVLELDVQSHIEGLKYNDMKVITFVCGELGCPIDYFFIPCRKRECVDSRHLVSLYLRQNRRYTLTDIGQILCPDRKDHTSVLHSIKTAQNLIDTDETYRTIYSMVIQSTTEAFTSMAYKNFNN
jgi:chromosomal replication initiation ATPase DnaA